ncbi:MAG: type II toxin-antitoxin system VapC family toxin [Verrucomicrobia bacterium]|nr:type II toxin-antitoxin system VapC family toxin [Verrucomicrobiota bacterium]
MICSLDTNIIVALLRKRDRALSEKYLSKPPGNYSVPEMVRAELLFGASVSAKADENRLAVEKFLAPIRLLPFQGEAVEHYAEIRRDLEKTGNSIGPNDLIIAATARANGHTLITRNTSEFLRVSALAVEEW